MKHWLFLSFMFLTISCSSLIYRPSEVFHHSPKELSYDYKDFFVKTKDNEASLHSWLIFSKLKKKKGVILFFHDNNGNISHHLASVTWMLEEGFDVLMFDYRRYGTSTSIDDINQVGTYFDALAMIDEGIKSQEKHKYPFFIVWGQGLGGTIALRALMDHSKRGDVDIMVMDSSYCSYQDLIARRLRKRWFTTPFYPFSYLFISDETECLSYVKKWDRPIVLIHGEKDNIVPISLSEDINKELDDSIPKWFWKLKNKDHLEGIKERKEKFHELITGMEINKYKKILTP